MRGCKAVSGGVAYLVSMKSLLLAVLLACSIPTLAQTVPTVGQEAGAPFKGANVVLIHSTDSASVAYDKVGRLLLSEGYALDKTDKGLGFIGTSYREVAKGRAQVALRFTVIPAPSGVVIQGRAVMHMPALQHTALNGDSPAEYRGMKGSPMLATWEELNRVAAAYPGGQLAYKRQP